LLLHAFGKIQRDVIFPGGKHKSLKPHINTRQSALLVYPLDFGKEEKLVSDLHLAIETTILRKVANLTLESDGRGLFQHYQFAVVRGQDIGNHAHGGRLPRPVWPQQSEDGTRAYFEGKILNRNKVIEMLRHIS